MGEIVIRGPGALDFVQLMSCNDHQKMTVGRAQYTGIMYPEGTFVDDTLVHKMADDEYLLVVNAANRHKDVAYLTELASGDRRGRGTRPVGRLRSARAPGTVWPRRSCSR